MQDRYRYENGPVDIRYDAPRPRPRPRPAAQVRPGTRNDARRRSRVQSPQVRRPQAQPARRRPAKRLHLANNGLLPVLAKVGRWLASLPKRFVKLWRSWFYRIYFPAVALALVAIFIGWNRLEGFAADYEASQPVHVADQVARLFEDGEYERIYDLDSAAAEISGGDRAFYAQSLSQVAQGKAVDCVSVFSDNRNEMQYNITLDGARFATFTLVPSGQTSPHGNTLWRLGTVTTNVVTEASPEAPKDPMMAPCHIQALPEYTVAIDGKPLTQADVIRTGIKILPDDFLPRGLTAPTLVEYGFYSENVPPQITVTAPDGTALPAREDSENIWVCGLREDDARKAAYNDDIVAIVRRVAKYTTQDISKSTAMEYVLSGSPAEEIIDNFSNRWAPTHKDESFENMEITDFWTLSEDYMVCHVSFDYVLTSKRGNDYTYPTEYTLCIVRSDGSGKLYNLLFH